MYELYFKLQEELTPVLLAGDLAGCEQTVAARMNGFDINPNRWFFDVFAYKQYGGHDDYDWLADWQSQYYPDMTITGLEPLQEVFASDVSGDVEFNDARSLASLLVVIKFQDLIRKAAPHMRELQFPLLATAHDFDFIFEVQRDPLQSSR